ncbi:hypothetical protein RMSM_06882, partial [Rhodopirellula maiorica SM1]
MINKQGVISGTLNNTATDSTQTIEGMVDKDHSVPHGTSRQGAAD